MSSARRVALGLLREWEKGNSFAADLIDSAARRGKLEPRDRGFVQQLLYAVLRNRTLLDHFIAHFSTGKLDPAFLDFLAEMEEQEDLHPIDMLHLNTDSSKAEDGSTNDRNTKSDDGKTEQPVKYKKPISKSSATEGKQ